MRNHIPFPLRTKRTNFARLVFEYEGFKVRTIIIDGEPWFVAADVCTVLELSGAPGQHLRRLDGDEKGVISIHTPGGPQQMLVVNEPGLYSLIMASRKTEAKAFRRWIAHEVIPAIRKDGMYVTPELLFNPDHLLQVTQRLRVGLRIS